MTWDQYDMVVSHDHVAIQDGMDMVCTHCGIILSLLDRPKVPCTTGRCATRTTTTTNADGICDRHPMMKGTNGV